MPRIVIEGQPVDLTVHVTLSEAARRLNCSYWVAWSLAAAGKLRGMKVGASWAIELDSVEQLREERRVAESGQAAA